MQQGCAQQMRRTASAACRPTSGVGASLTVSRKTFTSAWVSSGTLASMLHILCAQHRIRRLLDQTSPAARNRTSARSVVMLSGVGKPMGDHNHEGSPWTLWNHDQYEVDRKGYVGQRCQHRKMCSCAAILGTVAYFSTFNFADELLSCLPLIPC
jgi:hypothetical protein